MKPRIRFVLVTVLALILVAAATGSVGSTSGSARTLEWEVISRRAHDSEAFTQGLLLDGDGRLFESTGDYGHSSLREVDPWSGAVLRLVPLPDEHFGEGLALVGDRLVQLTWRSGIAYAWDARTFEQLDAFEYQGEGWGLCHDGRRLVMSDGSDRLTFRDARTFQTIGSVEVSLDGEPLGRLNELECVDGAVWANVFGSDLIVRIDPETGTVDGRLDLTGILEPDPGIEDTRAVLNGIAYDQTAGTFLVTGKHWPELIEIRVDQSE